MKKSCSHSRTRSLMAWLIDRFRYAFAGIGTGIVQDKSVRFQFILALLAVLAGLVLQITLAEWLWIMLCIILVIGFEIMNSCIEKTVDYISRERCEEARIIKDMAAGAVFLVSCFALFCAVIIFGGRILELLL